MKDYIINLLLTTGEYKYPISTESGIMVRTIRKYDQLVCQQDLHADGTLKSKEMKWQEFKDSL